MPINGQSVQVGFVARAEEIPPAAWREFFPPAREGAWWYQALEGGGLEDQFVFSYAVLTVAGRIVGLAPCFLHDVPIALVAPRPVALVLRGLAVLFPRLGYQRTLFVGSPCSEEGTVGLATGVTLGQVLAELRAAVLARARALRAPMVVFKDFPEPDLPALRGLAGFTPALSYPGTVVDLPPPDKEAYFRSLAQTQRHNLRKKLRRSRELLALETQVLAHPHRRGIGGDFRPVFADLPTRQNQVRASGPAIFPANPRPARIPLHCAANTGRRAGGGLHARLCPGGPGREQIHRAGL